EPLEWRDAIVRWTRRQLAGGKHEPPLLAAGPLHDVATRLEIAEDDRLALWLVYGAHLLGYAGIAPAALVEVCPRRWADALGSSELAATGAFAWRNSRVRLVPEVRAALDERAPLYGAIATAAVTVAKSVAVVAPATTELAALGGWAASSLGSRLGP